MVFKKYKDKEKNHFLHIFFNKDIFINWIASNIRQS